MQSWGWANVPPVAAGEFPKDTKVHQVSPASTSTSTDASEEGRLTPKDRRAASLEQEVHQVSPASTTTTTVTTSTDASEGGRLTPKIRRAALEQEVARLRKRHSREVNLHRALDRALQRPVGVLPRIPSYLPVKIQKLLAEVAVLEEEVIRLEDHVLCLRHEISDESTKLATHGSTTHKHKQPHGVNDSKSSGRAGATKSAIKDQSSKLGRASKPSQPKPNGHSLSKASKVNGEEPTHTVSAAGGRVAPLVNPTPGPRKAPAAAEVNEAVSKGQQQQARKVMGGMSAKSDLVRQFNALSCPDAKPPALPAKKLAPIHTTPRVSSRSTAFIPTLPLNRSDKLQHTSSGLKFSAGSTPRPGPRIRLQQPITEMSTNAQLWEKENLQSTSAAAGSKVAASKSSIRGSKAGLGGGYLFASNVERRSRLGHKV